MNSVESYLTELGTFKNLEFLWPTFSLALSFTLAFSSCLFLLNPDRINAQIIFMAVKPAREVLNKDPTVRIKFLISNYYFGRVILQ